MLSEETEQDYKTDLQKCERAVTLLKGALEFLALHGHGHDCTPTVLGTPEYGWWSRYLTNANDQVKDYARSILARVDEIPE